MEYAPSDDSGCPNCWFVWAVTDMPEWVPAWANGVEPESLYEWMLEGSSKNPVVHQAMKDAGMRPRKLTI